MDNTLPMAYTQLWALCEPQNAELARTHALASPSVVDVSGI